MSKNAKMKVVGKFTFFFSFKFVISPSTLSTKSFVAENSSPKIQLKKIPPSEKTQHYVLHKIECLQHDHQINDRRNNVDLCDVRETERERERWRDY